MPFRRGRGTSGSGWLCHIAATPMAASAGPSTPPRPPKSRIAATSPAVVSSRAARHTGPSRRSAGSQARLSPMPVSATATAAATRSASARVDHVCHSITPRVILGDNLRSVLVSAAVCPHPPLLVPELAGQRRGGARRPPVGLPAAAIDAVRATEPELLVVGRLGAGDPALRTGAAGSFAAYGARPGVSLPGRRAGRPAQR